MKNKLAMTLALLSSGLLAGVFYYGTIAVVPAFYDVPIAIHLKFRVALMSHNAVYVQLLTVAAILTPVWLAIVAKKSRRVRNFALFAALSALISIVVTRFGNVPVNKIMAVWEASTAPANWREILDKWNMFNNIRTVFALASFILIIIASQISPSKQKMTI